MMDLWANTEALGLTAMAILVIRILMLPLVMYNMTWSAKGFWQMVKGVSFPTSVYQSVVFLMSTGLAGYHTLALMGRTASSWSLPGALVLQCLFFLASIMAFVGRRYAIVSQFEKFYWLFEENNMEVAMRAAELNKVDPDYTDAVLDAAEGTLAVRMAQRVMSRDSE